MRFAILFIVFLFTTVCNAQSIVSTQSLGKRSVADVNLFLVFAGSHLRAEYDLELVRITYNTTGSDGQMDVASGLFIIPLNVPNALPLHCHQHGTTDRDNVPSQLARGIELGFTYASFGQFVIMPDYLGLGTSRGFHPFVHRATEASASVDLLFAAREYVDGRDNITLSEQLIISGYSQGGHAAMALQESIETNFSNDFDLVASTPMSGPYSISEVFKDFIFSESEYFFPGYFLYQFIGYQQVYGNLYESLEQILKEPYRDRADLFEQTGDLSGLHNDLSALLIANEGSSIPLRMFEDTYITEFRDNENHPLNIALRDNDTYNFIAAAPTRLIYCMADDQIPFRNSLVAEAELKTNGSQNVSSIDVLSDGSHGGCVVPAVEESVRFINQFLMVSSTDELASALSEVSIYPNPASEVITIEMSDNEIRVNTIRLYDIKGALRKTLDMKTRGAVQVYLSDMEGGMYAAEIVTELGSVWRKVVKQ